MFLGQMRHEGGLDPTRQLEFCAINRKCSHEALKNTEKVC